MTRTFLAAFATLATLSTAAVAGGETPKVYPFPSQANYCPAGLQPVTVDGTISCGTPDQAVSYLSVKKHPPQGRRYRRASRSEYVPPYKGLRE